MVAELSPLLAGQLALLIELPEIVQAIREHPKAYAGVTELHAGICEALGDYGRKFWGDPNEEVFPMTDLPRREFPAAERFLGKYAIGRASVAIPKQAS